MTEKLSSAAHINNILDDFADEIKNSSANYASTKQVESIKASSITFYFGDKVIGEIKFQSSGNKSEKVMRSKMQLMKDMQNKNSKSQIGQMLFSPFCKFKIH
jgi:hypothetical protein